MTILICLNSRYVSRKSLQRNVNGECSTDVAFIFIVRLDGVEERCDSIKLTYLELLCYPTQLSLKSFFYTCWTAADVLALHAMHDCVEEEGAAFLTITCFFFSVQLKVTNTGRTFLRL